MTLSVPIHLAPVAVDDLPDYPIPSSVRLESHSFFQFHHAWWKQSRFKMRADLEVKGAFLELICAAQYEAPVGTLPVDEDLLSQMAGVTLEKWRDLTTRRVSPLYGWTRCRCDNGEIKLCHQTVLNVALSASRRHTSDIDRKSADRERKRLEALPAQIVRAGGSERMSTNQAYVLRLDQFILDQFPESKSRTVRVVRLAMEAFDTVRQP